MAQYVFLAAVGGYAVVVWTIGGLTLVVELLGLVFGAWYWKKTRLPIIESSSSLSDEEFRVNYRALRRRGRLGLLVGGMSMVILGAVMSIPIYPLTGWSVPHYLIVALITWFLCFLVILGAPTLMFFLYERSALIHKIKRDA